MKVILATGLPNLDKAIKKKIENISFVGEALYREALEGMVERKNPDVVLLSNILESPTMSNKELILRLRRNHSDVRIIFLMKEDDPSLKSFLYKLSIYDVFIESFKTKELETSLLEGKQFSDVADEFEILTTYEKVSEDFGDEEVDEENLTKIDDDYHQLNNAPNSQRSKELYQQIVSSWSVLDQSGKTFQLVNTSLMLASNQDLKVLLLDFNIENPNIHLQFGFTDPDGNHNLGAVIDDFQNGKEINEDTFEDYLIEHPAYKNLYILPGYILKMANPDTDVVSTVFDRLISLSESKNFSTVLVDMGSGLRDASTIHILKKATKILMPITESPGQLFAVRRCFDKEVGLYVTNFIDRKKLIPTINQSANDDTSVRFKGALNAILDVSSVICTFHNKNKIRKSILTGSPLLKGKPDDDMYYNFVVISNEIHKNIFHVPERKTETKINKNNKGLLGNIFKK